MDVLSQCQVISRHTSDWSVCNLFFPTPLTIINSLWPGDAIWRQRSGSTLAQVMACCLTAPSHYLNQCWLIIGGVTWHSSQGISLRQCEDTNRWNKIENCSFKMASRSPRGQWVNAIPVLYTGWLNSKLLMKWFKSQGTSGVNNSNMLCAVVLGNQCWIMG